MPQTLNQAAPAPAAIEGLHHKLKFGLFSLAAIKGPDGMTEMAHLWWLFASRTTRPPSTPVAAASAPP